MADVAYDCGWENSMNIPALRTIYIIIMRSQKPFSFSVFGLLPLGLSTFVMVSLSISTIILVFVHILNNS